MTDCLDTISWARPFEGLTRWCFGGALLVARGADRLIADALNAGFQWRERSRERRQLAALSEVMLRDIGLTRADVERETQKPFWLA